MQEIRSKGKKRKAIAILAALVLTSLPVTFAEDMSPSFSQKDMAFSAHARLGEIKSSYPLPQFFETGLVQKTGDTCTDPGEEDGNFRCFKNFSNGSRVMLTTDQEHHGEEFKRQVQLAEFNARGEAQGRRTIRHKIAYRYVNDEKKVRAEFFDVVDRPKNGKITREIILYEYNVATGKAERISWTSYEQIGDSQFAMITRHVVLAFDNEGNPLNGRAEKWRNQVPVEKLFSWDRIIDGSRSLDLKTWETWKNQIFNASPRQIF